MGDRRGRAAAAAVDRHLMGRPTFPHRSPPDSSLFVERLLNAGSTRDAIIRERLRQAPGVVARPESDLGKLGQESLGAALFVGSQAAQLGRNQAW